MANDNIKDIDEDFEEITPADDTDWQAETQKLREKAIRQRERTKMLREENKKLKQAHEEAKAASPAQAPEKKEKTGFDYGEKAFLVASGVKADEYELVLNAMKETGRDLENVLGNKFFQAELQEKRNSKESEEALPSGSRRSGSSARNSVEYWIAKGELPPYDQRELRSKVVKAKRELAKTGSQFTEHPLA